MPSEEKESTESLTKAPERQVKRALGFHAFQKDMILS